MKKQGDPSLRWPMCLLWIVFFPAALGVSMHYECKKTRRRVERKTRKYYYYPWWW